MDFNDKISRSSLHVEVADRVREMIFDGTLAPGARIDELDLSAKLGTSRTPLREALKVLANEGLVRLAPGRGAFVSEMTGPEVDALFPVLAMLEGRCAAEAVRRVTAAEASALDEIQQRMERHAAVGDLDGFHTDTDQFHHLLLTVAGNPWLAKVTADLRNFLRLARCQSRFCDSRLLQSLAEHRTLMRSLDRRDPDSAEQIMTHHLIAQQRVWRQWRASVTAQGEGQGSGGAAQPTSGPATGAVTSPVTSPAVSPATGPAASQASTPATPPIANATGVPTDSESVGV